MKSSAINARRWVFYGILLLLFFLLMSLSARVNELNQLTDQHQMMITDVVALRATNSYLETQIAFASSDAAVDEYAREDGQMVKPGEILIVPISPNNPTAEPIIQTIDTPEPIPNWKIWYQLFFADVD
jgi:cell division protein FtsB